MKKITGIQYSVIGLVIMLVFGGTSIIIGYIIVSKTNSGTLNTNGLIENLPHITLPLTLIGIGIAFYGMCKGSE
jgi:hypothetical protein